MKNLKITIEFWREGKLYIANCPELDILAQGYSLDEARKNLHEVIEIHFEEMKRLGTLDQFLEDMGYKLQDDIIMSNREIIGFDKSFIRLETSVNGKNNSYKLANPSQDFERYGCIFQRQKGSH